jgi:sec-independent protein translocase protein TatA
MNFGNLGFMEILILLVLVLLLFGAKRLPEIGSSMGKGIREFKKSLTDVNNAISEPAARDRLSAGERDPLRDRPAEPARRDDDDRPEPKRLLS